MRRKRTPALALVIDQHSICRHLRTTWFTSNPNGGLRPTRKQKNTGKRNWSRIAKVTNSTARVEFVTFAILLQFLLPVFFCFLVGLSPPFGLLVNHVVLKCRHIECWSITSAKAGVRFRRISTEQAYGPCVGDQMV